MLLLFFAVWIVFNGRITLEIALFGIAIAGLMFWFMCAFMDYSPEKERMLYKKIPLFCKYVLLLVREIFNANLTVCKMILTRRDLRLLIFLPAILIPACASYSPAFLMMYSAYKLNKQGDNIQP